MEEDTRGHHLAKEIAAAVVEFHPSI